MSSLDWQMLDEAEGENLEKLLWNAFTELSGMIQSRHKDFEGVLEAVPRIAKLIDEKPELADFQAPLDDLARATGLWNFIRRGESDLSLDILLEAATIPSLNGIVLHRKQFEILDALQRGNNVILSAPTSFGKSVLIDALIATTNLNRIAIVLPTIALLDEFRRRLSRTFSEAYQLILHSSEVVEQERVIFLGTQERLIARSDLGNLDLTVVDEFYKLDPRRKDERHVALNAAVHKLLHRSKQFFFLGPNIDQIRISSESPWRFEFIQTRFSTVAVDTLDLRGSEDREQALLDQVAKEELWPAIVFVSSPDKANDLATKASEAMAVAEDGHEFADWLRENVGSRWAICDAVEFGFGVHHGRVPRAIAAQMVSLFNEGDITVLFCTSTLIEGVNTAAKSVLIYDKTINRKDYDFFTFSNIRGRAGRLGQHYVGKVLLFNDPPDAEDTEVSPTLFDEEADAPDEYIVQLDEADAGPAADERIAEIGEALGLTPTQLKTVATIGLDNAVKLQKLVRGSLKSSNLLVWSGYPSPVQLKHVLSIIGHVRPHRKSGAGSINQLNFLLRKLEHSDSFKEFHRSYDENPGLKQQYYESVFTFLKSCEYGLPQLFTIIDVFVQSEGRDSDYSSYVHDLGNWFIPSILKDLDEEGIPIQISERFFRPGDNRARLLERLTNAILDSGNLTQFERKWLARLLN